MTAVLRLKPPGFVNVQNERPCISLRYFILCNVFSLVLFSIHYAMPALFSRGKESLHQCRTLEHFTDTHFRGPESINQC